MSVSAYFTVQTTFTPSVPNSELLTLNVRPDEVTVAAAPFIVAVTAGPDRSVRPDIVSEILLPLLRADPGAGERASVAARVYDKAPPLEVSAGTDEGVGTLLTVVVIVNV